MSARYFKICHPLIIASGEMHEPSSRCEKLIAETMDTLKPEAVILMLLAVQKGNLELSIRSAVKRSGLMCIHLLMMFTGYAVSVPI